jgi:hypothetical protein
MPSADKLFRPYIAPVSGRNGNSTSIVNTYRNTSFAKQIIVVMKPDSKESLADIERGIS